MALPGETETNPSGPNWIRLLFAPDPIEREFPNGSIERAARPTPQLPNQIADAQTADVQVTRTWIADTEPRSILRAKILGQAPSNKPPLPDVEKTGMEKTESIRQARAKRLPNLAPDSSMNPDTDKTMTVLPLTVSIPPAMPVPFRSDTAAPRTAGHPKLIPLRARALPDFDKMVVVAPNLSVAGIHPDGEEQPPGNLLAVPAHAPDTSTNARSSAVPASGAEGADPTAAHLRVPGSLLEAAPAESQGSARNRTSPEQTDVAFEAHLIAKTNAGTASTESSGKEPPKPRSNGFGRSEDAEEMLFRPTFRQALSFHETSVISATVPAITPANTRPEPSPTVTTHTAPSAQPDTEPLRTPPTDRTDSTPVRELTVRVAPPGKPPVEVRVHQQQGETHVVVRTAEETTRSALRQDLPQLVSALDRAGFRAETFTPQAAFEFAAGAASGNPAGQDSATTGQRDFSGAPGGREPEQQQQRQRGQMHAYWLEQMEE